MSGSDCASAIRGLDVDPTPPMCSQCSFDVASRDASMEVAPHSLELFFQSILPALDERQRRLVAGATARMLGRDNLAKVAVAAGMSRNTVIGGIRDLDTGALPPGRVRAPGAGRKQLVQSQPGLLAALDRLIEAGPPPDEAPLRWSDRSMAKLAEALASMGFNVSADSVGQLLKSTGYRLPPPLRTADGPSRSIGEPATLRFRRIADEVRARIQAGEPVVSVTISKTLASRSPDRATGGPPDSMISATAGDGIYALGNADGWVRVLVDDEVAAVLAIRAMQRWWQIMGMERYPQAKRLMVVAGAESPVAAARWAAEMSNFAHETGLELTVCRLPPGTVKWTRIEQRLSSFVMNRREDCPVRCYRTVVSLSSGSADSGLKERAELDEGSPHEGPDPVTVIHQPLPLTPDEGGNGWLTIRGQLASVGK